AILSVDPYGIASDYHALDAIGARHGLKVLHDSAASFGTSYDGELVGRHGHAQIFSFHATKAFNTMEGGAFCSTDGELIAKAKLLRNFGKADADCPVAGFNGKMLEICALLGVHQLRRFPDEAAHRRLCASEIGAELSRVAGLRVAKAPANQSP